jgi:predicted O-linked N-acetylglucosamine transferase (SPINDLY family)
MLSDNEHVSSNLRREAEARGVDASRLIFSGKLPLEQHLARHLAADLFLDTFPYNAHTTASDSLWSGLPVLTCIGRSFAARVGASLLKSVGLDELISENLKEYEDKAFRLATQPFELKRIKKILHESKYDAPLFDTVRFTRNIEQAFIMMSSRWRAGLEPIEFIVPDGCDLETQ